MSWKFFRRKLSAAQRIEDIERSLALEKVKLQGVICLIPEYVECLVEEIRFRGDAAVGLDGRELHGPAERKLKKIEARIAENLGNSNKKDQQPKNEGLTGHEQRKVFLGALPGSILTEDQHHKQMIGTTIGAED